MNIKDNCLNKDEIDDLRQAFEWFINEQTGKINAEEILEAMKKLGFQTKNPSIYELVDDWYKEQKSLDSDGIDFERFIDSINNKLKNKETQDGMKRIFDLFLDDPKDTGITVKALEKIIADLGDTIPENEIKEMIKRASWTGANELSFKEFYHIMTKTSFP